MPYRVAGYRDRDQGAARARDTGSTSLREHRPGLREWLMFASQVVLVAMVEVGEDIVRGNLIPADARQALRHARQVISFESANGFFLEPRLQSMFLHTYHLVFVDIPSTLTVSLLNGVYAFCHVCVTLAVAIWVFLAHRPRFPLLRNTMLLCTLLCLFGYELYPLAPPRLSTGLIVDGRVVTFHDTVRHFLGTGRLSFGSIGYNSYSAMPSLHVAWALIIGVTVVLLSKNPALRLLGVIYPLAITFDVVVTGNHFLLDAAGAAIAAAIATLVALALEWWRRSWRGNRKSVMQSRL
jgi:hypothetical protein